MYINTFINGEFTTSEKATVNVEDRGLLFGDGVYDFVRSYYGKIFQIDEHLERLANSASSIEIELPYSMNEIKSIVNQLIAKSGIKSIVGVYIQLTRGAAPRVHNFPKEIKPNFFIIARPLEKEPSFIKYKGIKTTLVPDERWGRCDIKSLNLLPNVIAKEKAHRQDALETIFFRDYGITEASSSSVFAVFNQQIYTAPLGPWILPGITRGTVLNLAKEKGYTINLEFINKDKIFEAEEVFITNSRYDVLPVTQMNDKIISNGKPGEITMELKNAFNEYASR